MIHSTKDTPPEWCWLWHSEDCEWFWPRHGTKHMKFDDIAYDHITHWADAPQRPWAPVCGAPRVIPTP
jgi:hypothetical protein